MDQEQLRKAFVNNTELEYLFDDNQWLPAAIFHFRDGSNHLPYITLQLLRCPPDHSGIVQLDEEDIQQRLRIKGSH